MNPPPGTPERLNLESLVTDAVEKSLSLGVPGVVALAGDGAVNEDHHAAVAVAAGGFADPWLAPGVRHPAPRAVTPATLFDLASLTKVILAVATLRLSQRGRLDLNAPLADLLPEAPWATSVTARRLLSHTSGLPAVVRHVAGADRTACEAGLWRATLDWPPGTAHRYSCAGYQAMGIALERLGSTLPEVLRSEVLTPLSMTATTYAPAAEDCAATEWSDRRGLVRGVVHDHAAWVLGGAGNAGLFSPAADVAALGAVLADGRTACGEDFLDAAHHRLLITDQAGGLAPYGQGLGPRIGDPGALPGPDWVGHTGFTGTSLAVHPATGRVRVLLTNAVHPVRGRLDIGALRRSFA